MLSAPMTREVVILVWLCVGLAACDKAEIRAYRVPKDPNQTTAQPSAPRVTWTAPKTWRPAETTSTMRVATFATPSGVEVAVSAFPGDAGGLLANTNRWRGQIGLGPLDEPGLVAEAQTETVDGVRVVILDMTGDQRMLGAVIVPGDGQTWFVKATGEPTLIGRLKPEFLAFARSFRSRPDPTAPQAASAGAVGDRLNAWSPPEEWRPDANASSIVSAAFNTDSGARVTVTALLGDGGGALENINRWRDQLALPPMATLQDQPFEDIGAGASLVDLSAADGSVRIVAAQVPDAEQTWFFKMTGSAAAVDAELSRFHAFVREVGLGEGP